MSVIYKNRWAIACILLLSLVTADAQEDLRSQTNIFPLSSSEIAKAENFLDLTTGTTQVQKVARARTLESALVFFFFFLFVWLGPLLLMRGENQQLLKSFITALSYFLAFWLLHGPAWRIIHYWSSKTNVRFSIYNPLFILVNLIAMIALFTLIEALVAYLLARKSSKIRVFGYLFAINLAAHIALLIVATILSGQF